MKNVTEIKSKVDANFYLIKMFYAIQLAELAKEEKLLLVKQGNIEEAANSRAREKEILDWLSKGYQYKEIADKLFLSIETIRTYVRHIYEKLQVHTRTEALNKITAKKL